jgi:ubiquinone/menaquinone biosynthesis C-methylase UbiE
MFADPVKNLKAFDLREDMIVADLGAGTGFYSIAAAHMVPKGKVYAIEVQKDYVTTVRNKARDNHLNNIEALWGNIEKIGGTKIKDKIVDRVLASNVFSQVEDRDLFIEETKRILKYGGSVLLIDWSDGFSSMGPASTKIIPKDAAREMFEKKGFVFTQEIDAGAHHYGMIFRK